MTTRKKVLAGLLVVSGLLLSACSSGEPTDAQADSSSETNQPPAGYLIEWPEDFELSQGASGTSSQASEVYNVVLRDDPLVRGIVVVEEPSEPYEESQLFFRRELQPTIDAYNLTWSGGISATNQGVLSVPIGGERPGLFVNVTGEYEYGFAAVVPLLDGQLLKVILTSITPEDEETKQLMGRIITTLEVK